MNIVVIDGRRCKTREQAHDYLAQKLDFPPYYGKNLDALYDILTSYTMPVCLRVRYVSSLKASLGDYSTKFLQVLADVADANQNVTIEII